MFITHWFSTSRTPITSISSSINQHKRHCLWILIAIWTLLLFPFAPAQAQSTPAANTTATAGWTPLTLQPGAPAGSYALGDFDNINLFNGHLNFRLPLMHVGGRGRAGYTMMLPIEQNWIVQTVAVPTCNQSGCTYYESNYRYIANPLWWTGIQPGFGPGVLQGRQSGSDETTVIGCGGPFFTRTLTRLTFTAPDGTEIELRDMASRGEPMQGSGCYGGPNRGKTFISADGSAATFISDTDIYDERQPHFPNVIYPSGYLMLRDGTRYRIDSGKTSWIRDSNGNKVTFTYSGNTLTGIDDALNRHIGFTADGITFRGADGVTRTLKIHGGSLSTVLRKHPDGSTEYTVKTFAQLFSLQNVQNGTFDPWVTTAVELPDGRQYEFRYDSYANLAEVILPTGGRIEYDWVMSTYQHGDHVFGISKRVVERRTALDATTATYETRTIYPVPAMITDGPTEVTVDSVDPKNGNALLARTKHYFYGGWLPSLWAKGTDYPAWKHGREYKTEFFATDGTTVLKRIENTWQQKANVNWWTYSQDGAPPYDPRLVDVTTTLVDTNQVTRTTAISPIDGTVGFDDYNNRTDVWEYDYGSGLAGPLLRHTRTNYLTSGYDTVNPVWNNANLSITYHIRDLATQVSVYDAGGTEKARTTYEYDNYAPDSSTFHAALVDRVNISGHDPGLGTSYYGRGNVTARSQYLLPGGTAITSYNQYDIAGNVTKVLDPRSTAGNIIATSIGYDDNFGGPDASLVERFTFTELSSQQTFGFPTQITNAIGQSGYIQYDYGLGQAINQQDFNGVISAVFHDDPLDRLTGIRQSYGTAAEGHGTIDYDDGTHTITTTRDQLTNNDNRLVSTSIYDGFGRTVETRQYEGPATYIAVQTQYDALNRAFKTSNPFRPLAPDNEVARWTTSTFDGLGRLLTMTTPDDAMVSTSYLGNAATVYDQLGNARKSVTDALGRLKTVYEDPSGLTYQTDYGYDALDNLTSVTQGTQSRTFVYDSLRRLTSAANPENGTVSYQYSNAGNVIVMTDARGVSMHASYDALNRVTRRWYNGSSSTTEITNNIPALPSTVAATDEANFYYDSQTLPSGGPSFTLGTSTGRLIAITYGGATSTSGDYFGYDNAGRNIVKVQRTGNVDYPMSAVLNVSGGFNSVNYPSNRVVNYGYDDAGRMSSVSGTLGDGTTRNYSTEILYSPFGGLTKEKFGTSPAVYNKLFYNGRGQLAEIRDSTSWTGPTDSTWNRGSIINHYSAQCSGLCGGSNSATPMTDNNGNLLKQEVSIPDDNQITGYTLRWQQYDYDSLNRLKWAREVKDGAEQWRQWFKYDRWGNRTTDFTQDTGDPHLRTYGVISSQFKIDPQTNQLYAPNDQFLPNDQTNNLMKYDQAGNLKNDLYTGAGNRTYDAGTRITSAWGGNNQAQLYSYDAADQRVKRTVDGVQTFEVYGFRGELLAEYPANPTLNSPQKEYAYRNGQLLITASPGSSGGGSITTQNVVWTGAANVTVNGNSITKSAATSAWDAGASSTMAIVSGDGYVEMTVTETSKDRFFGLSHSETTVSYSDIDFSVRPYSNGVVYCYEPGTNGAFCGYYSPGDKFRVAIEGGVVKYYEISGAQTILMYTATHAPTYPLSADGAICDSGGTISNVVISGLLSGAGGGGTAESVVWTGAANVTVNGNSITKSAVTSGWDAGANSTRTIVSGDGYVEMTVTETNKDRFFGLSHSETTVSYSDIDFSVRPYSNGVVYCYEPGTNGAFCGYYSPGDKFRVAIEGGVVKYYQISGAQTILMYTATHAPTYPLSADGAIYDSGGTISNVVISGLLSGAGSGGGATSVQWIVADQLGTPRIVLDQSGELANVKRHDYLPFGEELLAPTGGRTAGQGYAADGVRQQFTGKERDTETGLDYFLARYYSSSQGRFVSVDPLMASAHASHPQTWNRYSYALNNPLRHTDPTGMMVAEYDQMSQAAIEKRRWFHAEKQAEQPADTSGTPAQQAQNTSCRFCLPDPCAVAIGAIAPGVVNDGASLLLAEGRKAGVSAAQMAYVFASAQHETDQGRSMVEYASGNAYEGRADLGNTQKGDGPLFKGRGFVQITGRTNYQRYANLMGIDLIGHPEQAAEPANSAFITVDGMTNGTFTGVSMSRYINDKTTDFYHARAVVNADTAINGQRIAGYAQNYLTALQGCKFGEPAPNRFR